MAEAVGQGAGRRPRRIAAVGALLIALTVLMAAFGAPAAPAADGLPPGVPVPAWAKGKKVHFEAAEPRHPRSADEAQASSSAAAPLTSSSPRLRYGGGTVENEPRLVLIFLGEEWEVEPALRFRRELETTAQDLTGSAYEEILTQYGGLDGPISQSLTDSPVVEMEYVKRAITTKIDHYAAVRAAEEVIARTGSRFATDTTYEVLPAPGTAEEEINTCGFHEEYGTEAGPSIAVVMDTEERIGCSTTKTLTHEYAEGVTDPDGASGWNTGEGSKGEIGDICNGLSPGRLADGALVAWLWDDSKGACEIEDTDPGSLPIGPYTEWSHRNPSLEGATNLNPESEKIETSIYPCNLPAHYYFEYGTTEAYREKTAESVVPAKWGAVKVSATVSGLQHSVPYHWRVVVSTANGTADGPDHEFTIPYYAEVKGERASDVGLAEATLNGEVRPVGVETKYYFEYGTTTAYGSSTAEADVGLGSEFVEVGAPITELAPGTRYHYRLVATNARGTTRGEDKEFETLGGKPVVFTEFVFTLGYTSATLKGDVYGKGEPTQYYFEYGTTTSYGQRTEEHGVAGMGNEEEKEPVSGLTPGTHYYYRIAATNSYGTSYGAAKSFLTPQEPVVETGAPVAVSYEGATLKGTINPRSTKTSYYFEYGTSQSYGERTAESEAGSGTSAVPATGTVSLAEDTTYHFRLVATTEYGTTYGADRTLTTSAKPLVQTDAPALVASTAATLSATIDPRGTEITYYFEYGPTLEPNTSTAPASAGAGNEDVEANETIGGLTPGSVYQYRVVAVDGSVKQYGAYVAFTTVSLDAPVTPVTPVTPVGPASNPAPPPSNPIAPGSTTSPPTRPGVSLKVARHGSALSVLLELGGRARQVVLVASAPRAQLGVAGPKGDRGVAVELARLVRTDVGAGETRLMVELDARAKRVLARGRHLTLTLAATVFSAGEAPQKATRTLVLAGK